MNLALYIARRYLFAKKSHNAIHIISAISVCGVALATMAMVCTLSVFNGFHDLVDGLFTSFNPDLRITVREGKVFDPADPRVLQVCGMDEVAMCAHTIEENAMVRYRDRQLMVTIKGVDDNFEQLTSIDSILYGAGQFILADGDVQYALPGMGVAAALGTGLAPVEPLQIYAPKRNARVNVANPAAAFVRDELYSSGTVFLVNQEKYDEHYVLTSLPFARHLFSYLRGEVTAVELSLKPGADVLSVQRRMQQTLGKRYVLQNRYEQQQDVFRIMEIEKFISYLFLTFILLIATFNVVGSLSMLLADKRDDTATLHKLGASRQLVERIFMFEGWLISVLGAVLGVVLGVLLCGLQSWLGIIRMGSDFIVDAYPVSVHLLDVVLVLATVLVVGGLSVIYPVKYMSRQLLDSADGQPTDNC